METNAKMKTDFAAVFVVLALLTSCFFFNLLALEKIPIKIVPEHKPKNRDNDHI